MSFHPWGVRPIGSPQFEDYLTDLFSSLEYERKDNIAAIPPYPVRMRKEPEMKRYDPVQQAWLALDAAIKGVAVQDYLREYRMRLEAQEDGEFPEAEVHECRCLELENEYFRQDEELSELLDRVLREVVHDPGCGNIRYRIRRIKQVEHQLGYCL